MLNTTAKDALEGLIRNIDRISTSEFRQQFCEATGNAALRELAAEFNASRDPYGRRWSPLGRPRSSLKTAGRAARGTSLSTLRKALQKAASRKILIDTGRLVSGFRMRPNENGFRLWTGVPYAAYHQYGANRRQMVPEMETGGVGSIWGDAMNRAADSLMRQQVAA